jgi:hypothetical protein
MFARHPLIFALFVALFSSGCATFGSMQRANTMGQGEWQFAIEPGVKGVAVDANGAFGPDVTMSFRAGVSDKVDIGGRIGTNIYDVHMKYQFTDKESTGPVLSLAPAMSVFAAGGGGAGGVIGMFNVPLLVGLPVGEHQVVFGPRVVDYFFGGGGGGGAAFANVLFVGSSFAFAAKAGERFGIIPELTLLYPVVGAAGASGEGSMADSIGGGLLLEFKLAFVIGAQ